MKSVFVWVALGAGLFIYSCQAQKNEIQDIALKMKDNHCRIQEISRYVDDSWTKSINELGDYLPERLPDQERENILNLKNAELIRMFESYAEFKPEGQALVDSMEQLDILWADSLRHLSLENKKLEMKIDSLFSMIDDNQEEARLNQIIEDIKSSSCPNSPMEQ